MKVTAHCSDLAFTTLEHRMLFQETCSAEQPSTLGPSLETLVFDQDTEHLPHLLVSCLAGASGQGKSGTSCPLKHLFHPGAGKMEAVKLSVLLAKLPASAQMT